MSQVFWPEPVEQVKAARRLLASKRGLFRESFARSYRVAIGAGQGGGWIFESRTAEHPDGRPIVQGLLDYFDFIPNDYREIAPGSGKMGADYVTRYVLSPRGVQFFESMLANRLKEAAEELDGPQVITGAAREARAREMMLDALKAIALDEKQRAHLELEDPDLLLQVYDAIRMAEPIFELPEINKAWEAVGRSLRRARAEADFERGRRNGRARFEEDAVGQMDPWAYRQNWWEDIQEWKQEASEGSNPTQEERGFWQGIEEALAGAASPAHPDNQPS